MSNKDPKPGFIYHLDTDDYIDRQILSHNQNLTALKRLIPIIAVYCQKEEESVLKAVKTKYPELEQYPFSVNTESKTLKVTGAKRQSEEPPSDE